MNISAIWLMTEGIEVKVLIEVDGLWYQVIKTCCAGEEMTISHCVHLKDGLPPGCEPVDYLNVQARAESEE